MNRVLNDELSRMRNVATVLPLCGIWLLLEFFNLMVNDVFLPIDTLEKIDPKNLGEKVEMVEKNMEGKVKSVAMNAKKEIEEEEKMAKNFVKNPSIVVKEGEQKLENVEKKAEGELENVAKKTEGELESKYHFFFSYVIWKVTKELTELITSR